MSLVFDAFVFLLSVYRFASQAEPEPERPSASSNVKEELTGYEYDEDQAKKHFKVPSLP